ncbi:venom acid phosphatase Acph-1 [Ooceraea biroi]|uniref:venom acid phosphatase Acph-1 n=1 Tax=Ooceraea biroi TaxID=2015173 RepID=UPI000F090CAC|nr:venom acid phosphatase Acph-1 [Ooceraea biroi]
MANLQCYLGIVLLFYSGLFTTPGVCREVIVTRNSIYPKLRLVSAVFRHGDRTLEKQIEYYPDDPHKHYDTYPVGDGQLTNAGKDRAYKFGQVLKEMYKSFLGDVYYQPNIYAQSSAVVRCKMTLQLVLAALYPPNDVQKWNPHLSWQPADFKYTPADKDDILFSVLCPAYIEAVNNLSDDPTVKMKVNEYSDLMKEMSQRTGKNMTTISNLFILYHTLITQVSLNLDLPDWAYDALRDGKLLKAALLQYDLFNYNDQLIQYGGLLYNIINDMNNKIHGTLKDRRINLFSAHDIHVAAMLKALKIFDNNIPQFTSSVIIELRENDGDYFVRVLHYLGIPSKVIEVIIPGCETLCSYDKFVTLISTSIRTDNDPTCLLTRSLPKELEEILS